MKSSFFLFLSFLSWEALADTDKVAPPSPEPAPAAEVQKEKAIPVATAIAEGSVDATSIAPAAPLPSMEVAPKSKTTQLNVTDYYQGIVRVEVAKRNPDFATPWQAGNYASSSGTGFLVSKGLFMTNAHVIANAERIYISKYGDARKIPAHVRHVAHDADLALLEIEETTAFDDVPIAQLSHELPKLEETVRVVGYPIGGTRLSVTRGIVSRIETNTYAHPRNSSHLTVQVDAAINPGNSGGPAFKDDKVIGVAFQGLLSANSTGYIIPAPVIQRFLTDVQDGLYDQYVDLGVRFFHLQNPSMREQLGLKDDGMGVLVGDVISQSSCDGVLERGDVILRINDLPVDSSAMIELDGERMQLNELAERAFKGDQVRFHILRDGQHLDVTATLRPLSNNDVIGRSYDKDPRFVTFAGLLFQPLGLDVIEAHKINSTNFLVELSQFVKRAGDDDKEDIVLLTKVLTDELNARFSDYGRRIVTKVNGVEVKGLNHLYELLYPKSEDSKSDYVVIELADASRPLIFERRAIPDANARIATKYRVTQPARLHTGEKAPK
ncbi:MAG: trypsin-like peptidase domain-containing protein [Akkermansia sp.]